MDKIVIGNHILGENDYKTILFSSIIEKSEGYSGNLVSGKFNIFENSNTWLSGSYNFTSNIGDKLSGFFSVRK